MNAYIIGIAALTLSFPGYAGDASTSAGPARAERDGVARYEPISGTSEPSDAIRLERCDLGQPQRFAEVP